MSAGEEHNNVKIVINGSALEEVDCISNVFLGAILPGERRLYFTNKEYFGHGIANTHWDEKKLWRGQDK